MRWLILMVLLPSVVLAHELWFEKSGDKMVLYYGHMEPKSGEERFIKYKPKSVLRVSCFDANGRGLAVKVEKTYPLSMPTLCSVYYALFSTGYWTKTVEGLKNLSKDEVSGSIESWLSYESVKRVDGWTDALSRPLTEDIEIVPLEDPFGVKVYEKISLRVYYRGKPVKDAVVAYDEHPIGTTDEEGRISVRVRHKGIQRISTSVKEKADGVRADYIIRSTSLIFEVK